MPIRFRCSQCYALMQVADAAAGHKTQCPSCRRIESVPNKVGSVERTEAAGATQEQAEVPGPPSWAKTFAEAQVPRENTSEAAPLNRSVVQVRCPQCHHLMRATDGTTVNCPLCNGEIEVSVAGRVGGDPEFPLVPVVSPLNPQGVAGAFARPSKESSPTSGGNAAGENDRLAGDAIAFARGNDAQRGERETFPRFSNPYAVTTSLGGQGQSGSPIDGDPENRIWQYTVNGIVFILLGLFYLVSFVGASVQLVFALTFDTRVNPQQMALLPAIFGLVITLSISVVYLLGGLAMVRQKSLGLARTAAVLALIPPFNLCFLFPFGIWATTLTFSGRVRSDFQ